MIWGVGEVLGVGGRQYMATAVGVAAVAATGNIPAVCRRRRSARHFGAFRGISMGWLWQESSSSTVQGSEHAYQNACRGHAATCGGAKRSTKSGGGWHGLAWLSACTESAPNQAVLATQGVCSALLGSVVWWMCLLLWRAPVCIASKRGGRSTCSGW